MNCETNNSIGLNPDSAAPAASSTDPKQNGNHQFEWKGSGAATQRRLVTHRGVWLQGVLYNSSDLQKLRHNSGPNLCVQIQTDARNRGSILLKLEESDDIYRVPALRLAQRLSESCIVKGLRGSRSATEVAGKEVQMNSTAVEINNLLIPHAAFADGQKQIERRCDFSPQLTESSLAMSSMIQEPIAIFGEAGTGKTTLLESIRSTHRALLEVDHRTCPALIISALPGSTRKRLALQMLEALGMPYPPSEPEYILHKRLRFCLREMDVRVILLDNCHNLFADHPAKAAHSTLEWLVQLSREIETQLVIAGIPLLKAFIMQDRQIGRRFVPIYLPKFQWEDLDQRAEFLGILNAYLRMIAETRAIPPFDSKDMGFRFHCATGGIIGNLATLLRRTLIAAEFESRTSITLSDFAKAHSQSLWFTPETPPKLQPFDPEFNIVSATSERVEKTRRRAECWGN